MNTLKKQEALIYLVAWAVVLAVIPLSMGFSALSGTGGGFSLQDLKATALQILPFLVLFFAHNYSLAPLLARKQGGLYLVLTSVLFGLFVFYCIRADGRPLDMEPWRPGEPGPEGPPPGGRHFFSPEWLKILLGLLVILVNLGVKSFFVARRRGQEIAALQARSRARKSEPQPSAEVPDTLLLKVSHKTIQVRIKDIRYIESMSEYMKVYFKNEADPLVVLYSLKRVMEQLPAGEFMRIHRSYIVALSCLSEASASEVLLDNGTRLPVGEVYRPAFREYLNSRA